MNAYDFHMALVRDALVNAKEGSRRLNNRLNADWLREGGLISALKWIAAAKKNLALAEAEIAPRRHGGTEKKPRTLRPLCLGASVVKTQGGRA